MNNSEFKRKESYIYMMGDDSQSRGRTESRKFSPFNIQLENSISQQSDDDNDDIINNTTNRVSSSFLILYEAKKIYYACFYDPILREIKLLEPIQFSSNIKELLTTLIKQLNPQILLCNIRVKHLLNENNEIEDLVKIELKTMKEFSYVEGDLFLEDLAADLNDNKINIINEELKLFLHRLKLTENYKYYCCLMSVFSLEFEALDMGQNRLRKTDVIQRIDFMDINGLMELDIESMISLDIIKFNKIDNSKKTIADLFGKTCSKIGASLLASYLIKPLYDTNKINERLSIVEAIMKEMEQNNKSSSTRLIMDGIRGLCDISKVIHSLQLGDFKASVWKKLRNFIINLIKIKEYIEASYILANCMIFKDFLKSFQNDNIVKLKTKLEKVLDFDTDSGCVDIRNDYNKEFEEYRNSYDEMEKTLNEISIKLSKESNLDIVTAYIPQFGYLIAIERKEGNDMLQVGLDLKIVFQTSTTNYYKNDLMYSMDKSFGDLYSLIRDKEIEILYGLKSEIIGDLKQLIKPYALIGHIDVMIRFAIVSLNNNFCKPQIQDNENESTIEIIGSFHPLIKKENFIKNNFEFKENKIIVITGPNYSGKSTLLTQIGITIYLMQIGCFIPATSAKLSIFQNILTRINTMDSINISQSTFMKDCQQMSKCIYRSGEKSLVLIDEFGKGTDINDGPGLLGGVVKHYLNRGKESPFVIITTHITEIFKQYLIGLDNRIQFAHMNVIIEDKKLFKITFLYELVNGIELSSCGLYCARQCGIALEIIERAQYISDMIDQGKDIADEFSQLNSDEICIIKDNEERIKKFLELDFQEWPDQDVKKLRNEVLKILQ